MFARAPLRALCRGARPKTAARNGFATYSKGNTIVQPKTRPRSLHKSQCLRTQQTQRRHAANLAEAFREEYRKRPVLLSLNAGLIALIAAIGIPLVVYHYRALQKEYDNFPEEVRIRLTRGLYFMNEKPDYAKSMKSFVKALQLAEEYGMDRLGDEVFLIKWYIVMLCEKAGGIEPAIEILRTEKQYCLDWIAENGGAEDAAPRRARLLSRAVDFSTRMAELYTSEFIGDTQKSEECLVWSLETTLKERERIEKEGRKPDEGEWFKDEQLETQLEALGHVYEEQNKFYFATQLFLKALQVKSEHDCHSVILMNNVAAAMAQHLPPVEPGTPTASKEQMRESGRAWANQALALAAKIQPPIRTEECDIGCAVATHNLAEFAEMDGNLKEARERYQEAGSLAHAIGFEEGIANADEALRRLGGDRLKKSRSWFG